MDAKSLPWAFDPSDPRRRAARAARTPPHLPGLAVCVRDRARGTDDAGELAKLPFPSHPHMLRHACGYQRASEGQDTRAIQQYLGHRNITHTVALYGTQPGSVQDILEGLAGANTQNGIQVAIETQSSDILQIQG